MRLLLSILALVFVLVPAEAYAQSNGPKSMPPTESARIVGEAMLEAAAEGRCAAAEKLLASIPRRHRRYRVKLAAAPAVRACRGEVAGPDEDDLPDAAAASGAKDASINATAAAWGAIAVGLVLVEAVPGAGTTEEIGAALVYGGAIASLVAPSVGHWSTGNGWTRGMTIRTVALAGAGVASLAIAASQLGCDGYPGCGSGATPIVAVIAGALYVAGTFDDIQTAGKSARRRQRREPRWQVTPTVMTAPAGPVAGFAAAGRF